MPQLQEQKKHLSSLDGFRGGLAIWVYLGHLAAGVGYSNYLLGMHALAVDLFMVLSGFLMAYTWPVALDSPRRVTVRLALKFYIVRIFRIAPLYYVLLLCCYLVLPELTQMFDASQRLFPPTWAQGLDRSGASIGWNFDSFRWLYLHASFAFGVVPGMEASSPLPDWSLSLEMQFYLVFPFLLLLLNRWSLLLLAIVSAALALVTPSLLGSYLTPGAFAHFGQPSVLSYRLNAFLAGMLVAVWWRHSRAAGSATKLGLWLMLAAGFCLVPLSKPVILLYLLFVALVLQKLAPLAWLLSLRPFKVLGDISYSMYLSHLLVLIPTIFWLSQSLWFMGLEPAQRFWVAFASTCPLVILLAYVLHATIEKGGMKLGRKCTQHPWFAKSMTR